MVALHERRALKDTSGAVLEFNLNKYIELITNPGSTMKFEKSKVCHEGGPVVDLGGLALVTIGLLSPRDELLHLAGHALDATAEVSTRNEIMGWHELR